MTIAVFHNFPAGGGKRTVYEQVKGLLARGHQVHVFELTNPDADIFDLRSLGCPVTTLPFDIQGHWPGPLARLHSDLKNFVLLPLVHRRIAQAIHAQAYQVALIHPDKYTESPFILHFLKVPHVYHCHELLRLGYEPELAFHEKVSGPKKLYELLTRRVRVFIDRSNARAARQIITNSRFIQAKIASAYGRRSTICYSGVDSRVFRPQAPKSPKILFMGQRNFIGGFNFVQDIMALLPKTHLALQVFGFPHGRPDTKNDRVLARAYSSSLATLCVSYHEPFGLKVLESLACGTPVLAVNAGGYRESVVSGHTGWLLPRNAPAFAQKIRYLLTHPRAAVAMGHAGRAHVLKFWTWTRHLNQLDSILTHAAQS